MFNMLLYVPEYKAQLLQPSNILLKSRFRICNLKLYKLVDDLSR